ncbi:hypothetical protein KAT24_01925 [Candidatus Pacearchaeota archaeon]|nr:hypothetical protein [Candidatus Pacearchaeota archaeon]
MLTEDYYLIARENEEIFRNILKDLRENREERPMGEYIPKDLKTELSLDETFVRYSKRNGKLTRMISIMGGFTITNFTRPNKSKATIEFQNIAPLSGGGAELEYLIKKDKSVKYKKPTSIMRS